jgi:excisionase family DNA binding protein
MNNPFETIDARLSNIENLLLDLKHSTIEIQPEGDKLLTIKEAATLISLSVPTIYGLVAHAAIPVCKKGKRLYFSKQELTDWIKAGRKKTVTEIQSEASTYLKRKRA